MATYTINIIADYPAPTEAFETNEEYINFVMNNAALSYKNQYEAATVEDGITAAREAYNASLPQEAAPE